LQNKNNRWLYTVLGGIFLFIAIVIFVNLYIYKTHTNTLKKEIKDELLSVSEIKKYILSRAYQNSLYNIYLLKQFVNFDQTFYNIFLKAKDTKNVEDLSRYLRVLQNEMKAIAVLDTNLNFVFKKGNGADELIQDNLIKKINKFKLDFAIKNKTAKLTYGTLHLVDDFGFQIKKNQPVYFIYAPLITTINRKSFIYGYIIESFKFDSIFRLALKPIISGEKKYEFELIKTDNYVPGKVVRIKIVNGLNFKVVYNKTNIPAYYLPINKIDFGFYEGYDTDNEFVMAKIENFSHSKFDLLVKVNLKNYFKYRDTFALYLFGFTLIIISGGLLLVYTFRNYFRALNYKTEYELLKQKQEFQVRYETLLKNANDAIVLYDRNGNILEFNDKFGLVFGLSKEKTSDLKMKDIWFLGNYEKDKSILLNTNLFEGKLFETLNLDKSKNLFPVEVSIRSVKIENFNYNQAIIRDISERKKNEIELTEAKEKYKNLVENINDVIFTIDNRSIIRFVSPVIYNLIGYTDEEVLNKSINEFLSESDKNKIKEIRESLLANEFNSTILSLVKKNGDLCYVNASTRLNKVGNNEVIITGVLTDITNEKNLEIMLEKERLDLQTIIDLSPVAIYFKDKFNKYIKVNKAAALISNTSVDSFEGKTAKDIFPDTHDIYYKEDLSIMLTGLPKFGITERLVINGNSIWLRSDKVPWYDEKGEVAGIICFSVDITEQMRAESELIKEKELLHWILRTIPVGLVYISTNGDILIGNDSASNIFNLSFNQNKYKYNSPELLLFEPDGKEVEINNNPFNVALLNQSSVRERELCYYKKDGKKIMLSINTSPVKNESGSIEGIVASIEDITKRKEYELALVESEKRYRSLFTSMQEGFGLHEIVCDEDGKAIDYIFLEVNPSFERLTGLKAGEILNRRAKEVLPNLEDFWMEQYGSIAFSQKYAEFESYSSDLGKYFKVSAFSIVKGIFATLFEDITEKKKIEAELEQHRQNLEIMVKVRTQELNKSNIMLGQEIEKGKGTEMMLKKTLEEVQKFSDLKTRFISTASHEFRTPLTTISSSIQLLGSYGRKWDNEKYDQHILRILRTIDNLTELINDVLLVSKVESGKIEFNPFYQDLNAFCSKLVEELKNDFAQNHILDFKYLASKNEFYIDSKLLRSILTNLLTNAIKYSSVGELIKITIDNNEKFIKILIEDNGIGISEEDLAHLFDPFHRGKNVNDISGTGLGMSIVKRYVELHKGTIEVKSKINSGTTVKLSIPILLPENNEVESSNN